jgi:hypothetical protein
MAPDAGWRYVVTVGPESREEHPLASAPTWLIEAADEETARDKAELMYRRLHPEVARVRVRLTPVGER